MQNYVYLAVAHPALLSMLNAKIQEPLDACFSLRANGKQAGERCTAHDVLVNSAIMKGECTKQQDQLPKCIRAGRIERIADAASPAWASSRRSLRYAPVKSDATLTSNYSAIGTTPNGEPGVRLNVRMYVASTKYPLLVLDCLFNPMKPIGWPGGQQNSLKQLTSLPEPNWISRPHCNGPILIFY